MELAIRVLHFDDDADDRRLFAARMEKRGFEVTSASTAQATKSLARSRDPHVIVLDVMQYSDLDAGIRLCEELRKEPVLSGKKILMLSNREDAEVKKRSLEAGADHYLTKGDVDQCADVIRKLLGLRT
jgi:DNA-binding response OmpR family regulator